MAALTLIISSNLVAACTEVRPEAYRAISGQRKMSPAEIVDDVDAVGHEAPGSGEDAQG